MRNLIKKILKESKDGLILHIGEIVIVNGTFQDKEFNNKIGTVKYFKADGDIVGIEFEGWTGGHDGRISFRRNTGSIWEFFTSRKALKIYGYTIKPVDIDSDKFFISEQEDDFSWVNLPELPEGDTYLDKVRYSLLNTEFELQSEEDGRHYKIWLNNAENSGNMINHRADRFKPEVIIPELKDVVKHHKNEWYHPFYKKLYDILVQIK